MIIRHSAREGTNLAMEGRDPNGKGNEERRNEKNRGEATHSSYGRSTPDPNECTGN